MSLPKKLLADFDEVLKERGYQSRSKGIRDLTERIMRLKGVEHVKLTSTANGEDFKEPGHSHDHPHTH